MNHILPEKEVTLSSLAEHLENAGWNVDLREEQLSLKSENGLFFGLYLASDHNFVGLSCYLPLRKNFKKRLELINRLNYELFLCSFALDKDSDLRISYHMSYSRGLILAQFSRIVRRYESLVDYVRTDYDVENQIFAIGEDEPETEIGSERRTIQ